jgi:hypothetical protein
MALARLLFPGERNRKARQQFRYLLTGILVGLTASIALVALLYWLSTKR